MKESQVNSVGILPKWSEQRVEMENFRNKKRQGIGSISEENCQSLKLLQPEQT